MEEIHARQHVDACVLKRRLLNRASDDFDLRPSGQTRARFGTVSRREIKPRCRHAREGRHDLTEETTIAAGEVNQFDAALIGAFNAARERAQRNPAHGVGCAAKQDLHLRIVKLGALFREPAATLVVEVLQIISRVAPALLARDVADLRAVPKQAALIDVRQITKKLR